MSISHNFEPHEAQLELLKNRRRFNTANCGRRWGKSSLGTFLLVEAAFEGAGYPVAWYSPSYKSLNDIWAYIKDVLDPVIEHKNEQTKTLDLIGNAKIDFWSLDDKQASRGRKYRRVILDECAFIRNLDEAWSRTVMPTLADYSGDAYLFSTPHGKFNDWYNICHTDTPDWEHFHFSIYDNPHIKRDEIELLRVNTDPLTFKQEYLAEFVDFSGNPFFDEYDYGKHTSDSIQIDDDYEILLSFDFNYNPSSCIECQMTDEGLTIVREYQADGGTKNLLQKLEHLRHRTNLVITGDNSGHKHTSGGGDVTDFNLIEKFFNRRVSKLTYRANSKHVHSRKISNGVFYMLPIKISRRGCPGLIQEVTTAQATSDGKLKKDDGQHRNDLVDPMRYAFNYWFRDYEDIVNYRDRLELLS